VKGKIHNVFVNLDIHEDIRKASTPTSPLYTSANVYDECLEKVFARSWQWVGDADLVKVPHQVHPLVVLEGSLNEPIVLTRDGKDQVHCVSNVCTHRGNLVVEGPGSERFLRCRYHGRRFGLDGGFQHMPEFEGCEGFPGPNDHLAKVPFGTWKNHLFAGVKPAFGLDEVLREMNERVWWMPLEEFTFDPGRTRDHLVKCNWALYCENYLEALHVPFVHAELAESIVYDEYRTELFPHSILQVATTKGGEDVFDLPKESPDYGQQITAYYWWIFPNLMFNFYPWGLSVNVIRPQRPDRTRVSFIGYVWDRSKLESGPGGQIDRVEREDETIVETVQKGLQSRVYSRGRYSPKRETGTHHFHRLLQEYLS
jgi:choline monooxygenase